MFELEKNRIQVEVMSKVSEFNDQHSSCVVNKVKPHFLEKFLRPFEKNKEASEKIKILLCEDCPVLSKITRKLLEKKGYEVTTTETPIHFLSKASLQNFDFVITDNRMPYMFGTQFVEYVENELRLDLPMYIYSGDTDLKHRYPLTNVLRGVFEKGSGVEEILQTIISDFKDYKERLNAAGLSQYYSAVATSYLM